MDKILGNSDAIIAQAQTIILKYGMNVVMAIVTLIVGIIVAKIIRKIVVSFLTKKQVDGAVISFTASVLYAMIVLIVLISAIGNLGVQTASLVAAMGAAGLAVGLALQGSLSNFASGFLLVILHPFRAGDYIEGGGIGGIVREIGIFSSTFITPDNKTVIVPNSKLTSDNITNYSVAGTRRVDLVIGVGYGDDIDKVKEIIETTVKADSRVLADPGIFIGLVELGDSSVNFVVRPWVKIADYWGVFFDTQENIKKAFDANGISIPFPQQDVHIIPAD